ncbi:Patatin [Desulfurobacterium thermolithotrophum DSM 11699]|uniref:Patatin n=1 Tax=Desulfurobacterium thermolithotrophum (strain DSM 11699 / BSA) TaxID=868864 RepID=F0S0D5_DESTD|nr:patatin-like phospholipase family protein [Desulfurobacterium thermolithotrophum]ADY73814.1 Patatin [Desulfurobacterium thermolithotrophum DSM 11699]
MKIGVTLSGGFIKGVAHAGLLKALEYKGISPSFIAGSSSGAAIGVLYAAGYSPDKIRELSLDLNWRKLTKPSFKGGLFSLSGLRAKLKELIGDIDFKDLKIPFGLTVVNLKTLKVEFITEGKVIDYVVASCSIPPIFTPYQIGKNYYIDGGIRNCLPAEMVKASGCRINICSNVNEISEKFEPSSIKDVSLRVSFASILENQEMRYKYCDVLVNHCFEQFSFDFENIEEIFELGYKNGLKAFEEIEDWL